MTLFDIVGPPDIITALQHGKPCRFGIEAVCPKCGKGPRDRKLRAGILTSGPMAGKPWWGCMRCHCEKDFKSERKRARLQIEARGGSPDQDDRNRRDYAVRVFEKTSSISTESPPHRYLTKTRHLALQGGVAPSDLRRALLLHPEHKEQSRSLRSECIVAAIRDISGMIVGVHRTFLFEFDDRRIVKLSDPDVPDKYRVTNSKLSLGSISGCAIRLGIDSDEIGLCEGIESALGLSAAHGLVCWAAISAGGMERILLPKSIRRVVIGADLGDKSAVGLKSAYGLRNRLVAEAKKLGLTRSVEILVPPLGCADWAERPRSK